MLQPPDEKEGDKLEGDERFPNGNIDEDNGKDDMVDGQIVSLPNLYTCSVGSIELC